MNLLHALPLRLVSLFVKYIRPPKYGLSVCAQFRDEGPYLDEWLRFHVRAGVDHFFLYNDVSADNFEEVLRPWMEAGQVTLNHSKGRTQEEIYTHCLVKARLKTRWLAFIDLDEFLFTPSGLPLSECLKRFEDSAGCFCFLEDIRLEWAEQSKEYRCGRVLRLGPGFPVQPRGSGDSTRFLACHPRRPPAHGLPNPRKKYRQASTNNDYGNPFPSAVHRKDSR